jgi:hypothetical protein
MAIQKNGDGSTAFYAAKCGAIGLETVYFLVLGVIFSALINRIFPTFDAATYRRKSWCSIALEVFCQAFVIGIAVFVSRQIVKRIPYLWDGAGGFSAASLKEGGGGVLMAFAILLLQGASLGGKINMLL